MVNEDPEYQWIDRIRTPRASNEARQRLISLMSGKEVEMKPCFLLTGGLVVLDVAVCSIPFRGAAEEDWPEGAGDGRECSGGLLAVF